LVLTLIIDEGHASYEGTNEVVDAIVEPGTLLDVHAHAHDISGHAPELAKPSVTSYILRYSFVTLLIEDDIELSMRRLILASLHLVDYLSLLVLITVLESFKMIHLLVSHLNSLS